MQLLSVVYVRIFSEMARAMMLHSSIRWKHGIVSRLWPMAIDYSTYIYNHNPNRQGIAPADLFTRLTVPRHKLNDIHVFGCPVYVLHPTLQKERNCLGGNLVLVEGCLLDLVLNILVMSI